MQIIKMGKFDGILLATDWDGTFFKNQIFEENIKALKYFEENGGKFTVCSGRFCDFLNNFKEFVPFNTYTSCCNGAYIVDLSNDEVLYEGFCDDRIFDIVDRILASDIKFESINVYGTYGKELIGYSYDEYKANLDSRKKFKIYKVIVRTENNDLGAIAAAEVNKMELYDYLAVRSWGSGLEIFKKENSKGVAIKRIAEKLGVKLIVAAGDYENDIDMIEAADIGYAVENATDKLKKVADRITVPVEQSAISKIIYDIERDIDNNNLNI